MNKKNKLLQQRDSSPIENFLSSKNRTKYYNAMADIGFLRWQADFKSSVELLKDVYEKQNYCLNFGNKRIWVWEFDTHRIYARPSKGFSIEVICDNNKMKDANKIWKKVYNDIVATIKWDVQEGLIELKKINSNIV